MDVSSLFSIVISRGLTRTQTIAESLQTSDHETRMAYIAALDEFARLAPAAFETRSGVVMAFLLKKVLMVPIRPDPVCYSYVFDWDRS